MKYKFDAIINGSQRINKIFKSREKANSYLDKVLDTYNLEVEEIFNRNGNKHYVEFVCDNYNRITIDRV